MRGEIVFFLVLFGSNVFALALISLFFSVLVLSWFFFYKDINCFSKQVLRFFFTIHRVVVRF